MNLGLFAAKSLGLFKLAQWVYRKRLNILCFHGFSFESEHVFRPQLFMTPETFARRLAYLQKRQFTVLTLDEALLRLGRGESRIKDTVITIDDGFFSVLKVAAPALKACGYPATLYVTSYYSRHANPVYRLAVQYMFWKTVVPNFELKALVTKLTDVSAGLAGNSVPTDEAAREWLTAYGETELDEDGRMELLAKLGQLLDVPLEELTASRRLSLLTAAEISKLSSYGVDVQLHTHRHRFPDNDVALTEEIQKNREYLSTCVDSKLIHLCYPSGEWSGHLWPVLEAAGVVSATTCDPGLNVRTTPRLALSRFVDGEHLSDIQFDAEMTGFKQLLRDAKAIVNRARTEISTRTFPSRLYERYGGRKGWLRSVSFRTMDAMSRQTRAQGDITDYGRIVFACKGNICRSPYAEAKARQAGLSTASFGLDASTGKLANPSAARIARSRGVELDGHRATHINDFSFKPGDLVFVFEPAHLAALRRPGAVPKFVSVDLLGRWCNPKFPYLHDPYGLSDVYFDACFDRIDQAIDRMLHPVAFAAAIQ